MDNSQSWLSETSDRPLQNKNELHRLKSFFSLKTDGFTLIEMMAAIAIITILTTGILPLSQVVYKRTKEMELRNNLRLIRTAIDEYKKLVDQKIIPKSAAGSGYPATLEILVTGVDLQTQTGERRKFLRRIPKDPITKEGEWGLRSYADNHDSTIWGGQDVYDVYCLSDKLAIDGTKYSDW